MQLLAEIWKAYIAPRIRVVAGNLWQPENFWRVAPWVLGVALIAWGMSYFGIASSDLFRSANTEVDRFSHDTAALVNGEAMARIQEKMRAEKIEIEMPQTVDQDKDSKALAQELHAARQEMLEQRRQAIEKHRQEDDKGN